MRRRFFLGALCLILSALICRAGINNGGGGGSVTPSQFQSTLQLGAGGWLVGGDINPDGTRLARTDTYGGYIWRTTGSCVYGNSTFAAPCWQQLMTQSSFPAAYFGYVGSGTSQVKMEGIAGDTGGAYEVTSAPSNSSIIYMMVNGWIFKSIDKGVTFTKTGNGVGTSPDFNSATIPVNMGTNNNSNRQCGRKMAVDPINPSIVYAGSDANGLFVSTDGGANWTSVAGVPTGTGKVNYSIAFDPTSGSGGTTQTIYAYTNGATAGVYVSTNAGASWALTTGTPSTVCRMVVDQAGIVWAIDAASGSANGNLRKLASSGGTWATVAGAGAGHSVSVDPANASHIVVGTASGALNTSVNGGTTWTGTNTFIRTASDVPWLAAVNAYSMDSGDMIFDPSQCAGGAGSCVLVFYEGIGAWETNPPNSTAQVTWNSKNTGIEQLVAKDVIAPAGVPVLGVADRSTFYQPSPSAYPANYVADYFTSFSLNVTWALDWAWNTPSFMASVTGDINGQTPTNNNSGTSSDGGQSWTPFNSYIQDVPASAISNDGTGQAMIAVSSVAGLSNWSATGNSPNGSSGTIVKVIPYNPTVSSCNLTGPPNVSLRQYWPVMLSGNNIILIGSNVSLLTTICGRLQISVDTNPLTDNNGLFTITNVANNGGKTRVTVTSTSSSQFVGTRICISGVLGATEANGCWVSGAQGTNSFDLVGSGVPSAYVSGGVALKYMPTGGAIAVSTPLNMIMMGAGNDYPQCTSDGGQNWTKLAVPSGIAAGGNTGWINAATNNRRPIVADRATPNVFYMYNSVAGTYIVNTCAPTLQSATVLPLSNANGTLRSVPGYAGHLIFVAGPQGGAGPAVLHPIGSAIRRSTDGGQTWSAVANINEPQQLGIGPIAPGSDYPTVYMVGFLSNVFGIYRTTSTAAQWNAGTVSWTKLGDYVIGSQDVLQIIAADQLTWNKWYGGFNGSGFTNGKQNFLLKRDLDPASNDNDPMWLEKAA